jgi:hypothetical protein
MSAPVSDALLRRTELAWLWDCGGWEVHDEPTGRIVARIECCLPGECWSVKLLVPDILKDDPERLGDRNFRDLEAAAAYAEVWAFEIDGEELHPSTQDLYAVRP